MGGQITVRLDNEALRLLDAEVKRLGAQMPGIPITRSDAIRSLIVTVLGKRDAEAQPASGKRGRR